MTPRRTVAVLGAGIMGSATALHLARRGVRVIVFEREGEPFRGASRWNEGKIHLGFLYAADPGLATARALLPGGLDFARQIRELTGTSLDASTTGADDLYLIHRDSVIGADAAAAYFERVARLVREHPDAGGYLADVSECRAPRLSGGELERVADASAVVAAFRVPERSVDTNHVADVFLAALAAEASVELACEHPVAGVSPAGGGSWTVQAAGQSHGPFDAVVNALWEGRPAIDRALGHDPDRSPQHRYRVSVFARSAAPLQVPSAVVAVGPFGDIKNYMGRDLYLSWYPAGLLARGEATAPPPVPALDDAGRARIADAVFTGLEGALPWVEEVRDALTEIRVEGGWVYSQGRGLLDDPKASVHRRDRHGISRRGSYFSVDTGKYSIAPTLAERLAREIAESGR